MSHKFSIFSFISFSLILLWFFWFFWMDEDIFLTCQNMLNNFSFLKRENSNFKFLTRFRDGDMKFYRLRKFLELSNWESKQRIVQISKLNKLSLTFLSRVHPLSLVQSNFKGRRYHRIFLNCISVRICDGSWHKRNTI